MKKMLLGNLMLICSLVFISLCIYGIHYLAFGDVRETIAGIILSLAYVPIGMLYEILVIDKILEKKEKLTLAKRMNLIIGSFYHEVGNDIVELVSEGDLLLIKNICYDKVRNGCSEENFGELVNLIDNYVCDIDISKIDLYAVYQIIEKRETFILNLITNSTMDSYDGFLDMLMALLHLRDELYPKFLERPEIKYDDNYIKPDLCIAYLQLLDQWTEYMKELKKFYPALFTKVLEHSAFNRK